MRTHRKWLGYFERRYQLIIRNIENFAEYATVPFSYISFIFLLFIWLCLTFGVSLWLAKTVLAKWMNPAYIEVENQKKILYLASTVEALEKQIDVQTTFIENLQQIIQGKPMAATVPSTPIPVPPAPALSYEPEIAATAKEIPLPRSTQDKSEAAKLLLMPPINGMITASFNIKNGHYGVDIVSKEKDPIKAIATGIVIFSDWSVDTGWVMVIQHYNSLVSIYKHCAVLFKKVGNLVRAGDVIALMGNSGELSTSPHLHFELWHEGLALNPEDFYNF